MNITIDGADFVIRANGSVSWSSAWERIWELKAAGYFETVDLGVAFEGHVEFFVSAAGLAAAGR